MDLYVSLFCMDLKISTNLKESLFYLVAKLSGFMDTSNQLK